MINQTAKKILKALSFDGVEVEAFRHMADLKRLDPMKIFYKKIYDLRSKITHRSQLFIGDYELSLEEKHLNIEYTDWLMRLKTLQLFRLSLSNWLRYQDKRNK